MTNKTHFSPASEKGHFDGLVDEGKYLRQSSLYKQILPRTPIWIKTSVFSVPSLAKNLFNLRNLWLINDLRLRILTYEKINLFLQNEPKFRKSQMNVSKVLAMDYGKVDTWWSGKNKANSKPIQSQFKANSKPIQTQYKPNTNPKQTQNKPNTNPIQTQTKPISTVPLTPQEIALSIVCELVKIRRLGDTSGSNYMTTSWNNWKAEYL